MSKLVIFKGEKQLVTDRFYAANEAECELVKETKVIAPEDIETPEAKKPKKTK